jgi:hypothetical protein
MAVPLPAARHFYGSKSKTLVEETIKLPTKQPDQRKHRHSESSGLIAQQGQCKSIFIPCLGISDFGLCLLQLGLA